MPPRLTKFLALFLPLVLGLPAQPDVARLLAPHPIWSYLVCGSVVVIAGYLGVGLSGPTAAPRLASALGNPPGVAPTAPPPKT